ncbi:hypothetical protein QGN06_25490 [Achromobacter xylosoxidans]|uniref:hypothetical protein n=1 Tax=Alcaligenes xylosoxydans xylosoxydans TaxID=85698 RepID=UPI00073507C6|nr:hypothetical protein [Achromobacter xylosoxidans]PNM90252.1 hypothetical protein AL490_014975 [Achromobacter xylosoxidans]
MSGEFYRLYIAPTLPPLLIVLGWFFVSRDNDRRETRKEIRALINEYAKKLDLQMERVAEYFSKIDNAKSPTRAQLAEVAIKQAFDRLEAALRLIQKMDCRYQGLDAVFEELVNMVTGHVKFESRTYEGKLSLVDFDILNMTLKSKEFIDELEGIFVKTQIQRPFFEDSE